MVMVIQWIGQVSYYAPPPVSFRSCSLSFADRSTRECSGIGHLLWLCEDNSIFTHSQVLHVSISNLVGTERFALTALARPLSWHRLAVPVERHGSVGVNDLDTPMPQDGGPVDRLLYSRSVHRRTDDV